MYFFTNLSRFKVLCHFMCLDKVFDQNWFHWSSAHHLFCRYLFVLFTSTLLRNWLVRTTIQSWSHWQTACFMFVYVQHYFYENYHVHLCWSKQQNLIFCQFKHPTYAFLHRACVLIMVVKFFLSVYAISTAATIAIVFFHDTTGTDLYYLS